MRRTLSQFDKQTCQELRQRAFRPDRSISSLVRALAVGTVLAALVCVPRLGAEFIPQLRRTRFPSAIPPSRSS